MERDFVAGILRDVQTIMGGVSCAWRNQMNINHGAGGPGIALVDSVAMCVYLQRAIKMGALFHRAFAVIFHHAAPKDGLALVVGPFQFKPGVIGVHCPAGKKVSDLFSADDHIHAHCITTTNHRLYAA